MTPTRFLADNTDIEVGLFTNKQDILSIDNSGCTRLALTSFYRLDISSIIIYNDRKQHFVLFKCYKEGFNELVTLKVTAEKI